MNSLIFAMSALAAAPQSADLTEVLLLAGDTLMTSSGPLEVLSLGGPIAGLDGGWLTTVSLDDPRGTSAPSWGSRPVASQGPSSSSGRAGSSTDRNSKRCVDTPVAVAWGPIHRYTHPHRPLGSARAAIGLFGQRNSPDFPLSERHHRFASPRPAASTLPKALAVVVSSSTIARAPLFRSALLPEVQPPLPRRHRYSDLGLCRWGTARPWR
ncbi:hypothetical protein Poly30_01950 [Planctomycetes bacterium Poly30]|uniref:Secreted protein n=1 Tax=Saltatorellus ferox TaxID=2528018 RepID=A0A518EKU4_9BACT|nr:hypothetical protein Poly30_01950 [Planctomycetes bacterium Poly30]